MPTNSIHSDSYRALATILRQKREDAGITQVDLAAKLQQDQSFISKVERRERRLDLEELRLWCEAIGTPLETIVSEWQAAQPPTETMVVAAEKSQPPPDRHWSLDDWQKLLQSLVDQGVVNYQEITALVLGHLNPSQVGTSIASKPTFQQHYPKRKCWQAVREWHFQQTGRCHDCGTRLELQADHIETREEHGDAADRLENMTLRCRRCNVVRRPSHKQGGITFLTAEAALMWLLFTSKPAKYQEFESLCRAYGLTMANIRFQEAWAMARWLNKVGLYRIDSDSAY